MAASIETKKRLRAIRRLATSFPDRTAEERLAQIEGIANGSLEPKVWRRDMSTNLMERLAAGQASRSPRNAFDKRPGAKRPAVAREAEAETETEEKKKRGKRGGRDRMERDGLNRSSDVNL